jgi:N-acetylglutamate synthase/N-acetylornithine aminotransferase
MRLIDEIVTQAAYLETGKNEEEKNIDFVCLTYKALSKILVEVELEYGDSTERHLTEALSMPYVLIPGSNTRQEINYYFAKKIEP